MLVLRHLVRTANEAVLSADERGSIARSVSSLKTRLNLHFRRVEIESQMLFGSYRRNTILPRAMDEQSDVDYMVIFPDTGHQPQTYLDRLRRFVEARYKTSEIYQSSPTITLDLHHIRFELVPAVRQWGQGYLIPDGPTCWQETDPLAFHKYLNQRDGQERLHLRRVIRLAKYWNAQNGWPIPSFQLEGWIAAQHYAGCRSLRDYLFQVVDNLPTHLDAQWKRERVRRARSILERVRQYEAFPIHQRSALEELKLLIP